MYQTLKLGIVVPAYNEEKLIADTLKGIPLEADRIYVVDDASTDDTRDIAENFPDRRICILGNGHNQGVGAAIVTGYKKALEENMDVVVVMAGDNQMSAKYLPDLLGPLISGKADYSKGNRLTCSANRKGMSSWRQFGNFILSILTKIASGYWGVGDPQNGYTAITRAALKSVGLDEIYTRYGYCNDLLVRLNVAGARVVDVPMPARYANEKSKIRYPKYIVNVSYLLLRTFLWRIKNKYINRPAY